MSNAGTGSLDASEQWDGYLVPKRSTTDASIKPVGASVDKQLKDAQALALEVLPRCVGHAADIVERTQDDKVRLDAIKWIAGIAGLNANAPADDPLTSLLDRITGTTVSPTSDTNGADSTS